MSHTIANVRETGWLFRDVTLCAVGAVRYHSFGRLRWRGVVNGSHVLFEPMSARCGQEMKNQSRESAIYCL